MLSYRQREREYLSCYKVLSLFEQEVYENFLLIKHDQELNFIEYFIKIV